MGYFDVSIMAKRTVASMSFLIIASSPKSILNFRGALIQSLISKGYKIHVSAPGLSERSSLRMELEDKGIIVHNTYFSRTGLNPLADLRTLISLLRLMKQVKPHYVLSYTVKPVIYGSIAAQIMGVKNHFALITGLGFTFTKEFINDHYFLHLLIRLLYKVSLREVDKIFFQNPDDELLFKKLKITRSKSPTYVVNGSGVDLDYYYLTNLPEQINFLLIARLLKSKGLQVFAEAAKEIKKNYPHVSFTVVGKIDNSPDAVTKNELKIWTDSGDIIFLGELTDVRSAISNCSVIVLPSFYREGTPRSILEAMSMGRAVITTDLPGCRETVFEGKNGYLVEPKSVKSLINALTKLIENPFCISIMGSESRKIAEKKYDVHKVNKIMIKEMLVKNV